MIIDLKKFIARGKRTWKEFESILDNMERNPGSRMDIEQVRRFHYLYQKTSADLARIGTFSAEPNLRTYLESLVARAYSEIHETRKQSRKLSIKKWFLSIFPSTFRRHATLFKIAFMVMMAGFVFGAGAVAVDPEARNVLMPFPHLRMDPSDRVEMEEKSLGGNQIDTMKSSFSSYLITHNIRVTIFVMALGITWGIGTVTLLFINGLLLGAVAADYILAGETAFLLGWLLPHGVVEIPAVLLGGQAGLLLASALIGFGGPPLLKDRFRLISTDLVAIVFGAAVLLVWAGIVEAFFSQYHPPVLPYFVKIGFGSLELLLLLFFLTRSGKGKIEK